MVMVLGGRLLMRRCCWRAVHAPGCPAAPRAAAAPSWSFDDAISAMLQNPAPFIMNRTCLDGVDLAQLSHTKPQLDAACKRAKGACGAASIKCSSATLSDGVWSIQRAIRSHGAAMARLQVNAAFKEFFTAIPKGVFNASIDNDDPSFWHAVLLVGE